MPVLSFNGLLVIALVAVAVPVLLALVPRLPVPGAVLEVAAGLLVRTIDLTGRTPHPQFQVKLEGIGFGFLIPVFFITTGVRIDVSALVSNPAALAEVPLFLLALLVVRAAPALAYVRLIGKRRAGAAGLMQAATLTFVIVATQSVPRPGRSARPPAPLCSRPACCRPRSSQLWQSSFCRLKDRRPGPRPCWAGELGSSSGEVGRVRRWRGFRAAGPGRRPRPGDARSRPSGRRPGRPGEQPARGRRPGPG